MIKIGNIKIANGVFLAPMAGFSDRAMRVVCHKYGAECSVSEMVSAKAVCFGDKKTFSLAKIMEDEGPVSVQIFGSDPDFMARAAERLMRGEDGGVKPIAIDINMGCPVNKIFTNQEGSALMRNPVLIEKIVSAVSSAIDIPCTVKLRAGVDKKCINAVECALAAESGGAKLVTIHGRTREEMYSGFADREIIREVKRAIKIPVIANGDIKSGEDALSMLAETSADGIMVGRAAIGNPFLFEEIQCAIKGIDYREKSIEEKIDTALFQLSIAVEEKGETVAVREARKQIALYLSSFRGAAMIRARINRAESFDEVREAMYSALDA